MIWQPGDRIYLKHTGSKGRIIRLIDHTTAMVALEGDRDEFPVHLDDLDYNPVLLKEVAQNKTTKQEARVITGTLQPSESGLFLAINLDSEEYLQRNCHFFLCNAYLKDYNYQIIIDSKSGTLANSSGHLPATSWIHLFDLPLAAVGDGPNLLFKHWSLEKNIQKAMPEINLRIKAKTLITQMKMQEDLPFNATCISLNSLEEKVENRKALEVFKKSGNQNLSYLNTIPDINDKAGFKTEIDLHAEKLFPNYSKMSQTEIYLGQIQAFESFLKDAIRLGIPRVYIIHGLGKGKLRNAILQRALEHPDIIRAENTHHPRFGFGATEIVISE